LKKYSADGLRLYLGSHHYRQEWSYDEEDLKQAEENARLLQAAVEIQGGDGEAFSLDDAQTSFHIAMENDLDTPVASEILVNFAEELLVAADDGYSVLMAQEAVREMGGVFGLQLGGSVESRVVEGWKEHIVKFEQ
jgi:cysteinyl-tRNA synthetase